MIYTELAPMSLGLPYAHVANALHFDYSGYGSSLFSVGNLVRRAQPRSAALRLLKVESGINGILPAGGGPLPFIPFLS
jgi:hypothetical protein